MFDWRSTGKIVRLSEVVAVPSKQSLFCSNIRGKITMKKAKQVWLRVWHASGERRGREKRGRFVALHITLERSRSTARVLRSSLRSSLAIFEEKRDCSQPRSFLVTFENGCFFFWLDCDKQFRTDLVTIKFSILFRFNPSTKFKRFQFALRDR